MRKNIALVKYLFVYLVIAMAVSCASFRDMPKEKQVLLSYDVISETLNNAKPILIDLCMSGTMSVEDCTKARLAYNEAVDIHMVLGYMAETVVDTGSDTKYNELAEQLMGLLIIISVYAEG